MKASSAPVRCSTLTRSSRAARPAPVAKTITAAAAQAIRAATAPAAARASTPARITSFSQRL